MPFFDTQIRVNLLITIGPYQLQSHVVLAPMAGITDLPFRQICRQLGAGMVTGEMIASDTSLWTTKKSSTRLPQLCEREPRAIQIVGSDPVLMSNAARKSVELGAQIIDINMGCPAKKVCKKAAGSALLQDEKLVSEILQAVVNAVNVPVTLKIRTGTDLDNRNGINIARIAENEGIQSLAVHGRTRACRFKGKVEYDTIAAIKQQAGIPVFANGDINTPQQAKTVLDYTGADGAMIGRAAQGNPWLFQQIDHFLMTGEIIAAPSLSTKLAVIKLHLRALHTHYGELAGLRIARKHIGWYLADQQIPTFTKNFNQLNSAQAQLDALEQLTITIFQQGKAA
ncbi:MAG: tRNA-dihydrouridine synthase B [Pseudomonadales bacterium]